MKVFKSAFRILFIVFLTSILPFSAVESRQTNKQAKAPKKPLPAAVLNTSPFFSNIGKLTFPVETKSDQAQQYVNQGLTFLYSFKFAEAVRSFRGATRSDPSCAMCYWGLAVALSSKSNTPINGKERDEAYDAIKTAKELVSENNKREKAYINAAEERLSSATYKPRPRFCDQCGARGLISNNETITYAREMKKVAEAFPTDIDAKVLYIAALSDVTNWNFWYPDGKPYPKTLEMIKTLESILASHNDHLGAHHLYIHIMEQSPTPEKALASADKIPELAPAIDQIVHIPSHIYYLLGRFEDASIVTTKALEMGDKYIENCHAQGFRPEISFLYHHQLHSLIASATMQGREKFAVSASKELMSMIPEKDLSLQGFIPVQGLTYARFGRWEDVFKAYRPIPDAQYALGLWYYTQALAHAHDNEMKEASYALDEIKKIYKRGAMPSALGQFGIDQLAIAIDILQGIFDEKSGNSEAAIDNFKLAVEKQDRMVGKLPPTWYFPSRELLGIAFYKNKQYEESKAVFQKDLEKNPNNPWSLYGLSKSLMALGDETAAADIEKELSNAWQSGDSEKPYTLISFEPVTDMKTETETRDKQEKKSLKRDTTPQNKTKPMKSRSNKVQPHGNSNNFMSDEIQERFD